MKIPTHPTLIERFCRARVRQLRATGPVLAASLVEIAKHCGHPNCRCQRGHRHRGYYLTFKQKRKTHTVYIPQDLLKEVKAWSADPRRLRRLSQELTALSVARIRTHVRARRQRAGRR